MSRRIRIGTRDSELALWQANTVRKAIEALGHKTELISVKATGDLLLEQPLYELGITGIFTKTLDAAMIRGDIDIAVHSLKDVPTILPRGIVQGAVLERGDPRDVLIHKGLDFLNQEGIIATGSLRRKAQWLYRYPLHEVVDLRGNVNTRLQKLEDNKWNAAIFAAAGLDRLNKLPDSATVLQWMIPAPAQGAVVAVAMEEDPHCRNVLARLNHRNTEICTSIERDFLRTLEGGCSAPIGALAKITDQGINFKGIVLSIDGKTKVEIHREIALDETHGAGNRWAEEVLKDGGAELMKEIRSNSAS